MIEYRAKKDIEKNKKSVQVVKFDRRVFVGAGHCKVLSKKMSKTVL